MTERSGNDPSGDYAHQLLSACDLATQRVGPGSSVEPALEWARSGAMALTGEVDGAPRFASGPLATAAAGTGRALASLAPGSKLATIDAATLLGERAAIAGLTRQGQVSAGGSARLLEARDGTLVLNLPRPDDWSLLPAWLESDDVPSSIDASDRWGRLQTRIALASRHDLVERGRLIGLAVADAPRSIDSDRPWFRREHASETAAPGIDRPIRLLDLSSLWAGPLAASLLAMCGVEVLKIESPERPDGARRGPKAFFDLMNANKEGCALDLRVTRDREIFDRLLDHADIVLESARPRALEQLGYDAGSWASSRAGRLWVAITGYGRTTAARDWIAYGDDAAIAAGLGWSDTASSDGPVASPSPCFCGDAIADPLTGLHAALITLAHLRTGRGGLLDFCLVDVCAKAGSIRAGRLDRPLVREPDGRFVLDDEAGTPIESPRARITIGSAPELAPPDEGMIERWTRGC
jgi:crotonobetainyl-CoA:carnitine CoA-transferase CaiB-like acyl-CoA transferase